MAQPDDQYSQYDRIPIQDFLGMDASRNPTANQDYGVGVLMINCGRKVRSPLQPRVGLRPVTSSNGNETMAGRLFALGALSSGGRLSLIARLSGGRLVAARDIEMT
jgi:hypothetical protein